MKVIFRQERLPRRECLQPGAIVRRHVVRFVDAGALLRASEPWVSLKECSESVLNRSSGK